MMRKQLNRLVRRPVTGALLGLGLLLAACQQDPAVTTATTTTPAATTDAQAAPAHPAAYVCPMGCEGSESDKPGKCPVCNMDLAANPAATTPAAN